MRKIKLIVIMLVLLCSTFILMGFDSEQKKVYDDAGILSNDEKSRLQQLCVDTAKSINIDIIIATTSDNQGKTATKYAEDFYMAHDFGYNKKDGDGILFLIDMEGRKVAVMTSGSGIDYLSARRIKEITNLTTSYLKNKDYNNACEAFLNKVNAYNSPQTLTDKLFNYLGIKLLIAFGTGIIVVAVMMFHAKSRMTVDCQTYVKDHHFDVRDTRDNYINTTVVKHRIQTNNNGKGGTHIGSGGNTFGGGEGSF